MRRALSTLLAVGLFGWLLTLGLPTQAAKPAGVEMTTAAVASAADGSWWVLLQAERITQPGNATWYVSWVKADGSPCFVQIGEEGTQTGATWGPTDYTFAYANGEALQLGEAYPLVVDVVNAHFVETCDHGVLKTTAKNAVLDPYVPLPWSVA
jgi:hypothetical protein